MESNARPDGGRAGSSTTVSEVWASYRAVAEVDPVTLRSYESRFARHVEPSWGTRPASAVSRDDVAALLAATAARGHGPELVRQVRVVLGVVFRHALVLGVVSAVPTDGVRLPRSPSSSRAAAPGLRVMTPEEFLRVREALPTPGARLLADVLAHGGLRIGEALALAPQDLDGDAVRVRRRLSEPGRSASEDGQRFVVRPATKNGRERRVVVGTALVAALHCWSEGHGVDGDALLFPGRLVLPQAAGRSFPAKVHTSPLTPERLAELGTFTALNGRTYAHGTVNGYVTGGCRSACCRQAISEYSAARRRARRERDRPAGHAPRRPSSPPTAEAEDGSGPASFSGVPPQAWSGLWAAAVRRAGLDFRPLARQTRHAHASWLTAAGVSTEEVAERLGHRDGRSTSGYVRPVGPEADPVEALHRLLSPVAGPQARRAGDDL